jgi:hypothetical protein
MESRRGLDQARDVLAPGDSFPGCAFFDQAADLGVNIELGTLM